MNNFFQAIKFKVTPWPERLSMKVVSLCAIKDINFLKKYMYLDPKKTLEIGKNCTRSLFRWPFVLPIRSNKLVLDLLKLLRDYSRSLKIQRLEGIGQAVLDTVRRASWGKNQKLLICIWPLLCSMSCYTITLAKGNWEFLGIPRIFLRIPNS